ncbi:hypothetical protein AVEN_205819-1 [Araneus ventricosus]|uniref:Uncharacterized protein n=1 Tax=Araneus ventricosus TaxID=182803 RepID=A0A4Y2WCY7_ARAVE|nr:hypothetical protein AVEN_205819-1 [Araneus ventricosus]
MTRTTPELAPPLQTSAPHQREDVWLHTYDLMRNRSITRRIFYWNRVSNMEPPTPKPALELEATAASIQFEKIQKRGIGTVILLQNKQCRDTLTWVTKIALF